MYFGQTTNCIWPIQELGFNPRLGMKHPENEYFFTILNGWLGAGRCLTEGPIYIYIHMDNHWVCLRSEGNPGFYQLQHVSSVTCPTGFIVGCTSHLVQKSRPLALSIQKSGPRPWTTYCHRIHDPRASLVPFFWGDHAVASVYQGKYKIWVDIPAWY